MTDGFTYSNETEGDEVVVPRRTSDGAASSSSLTSPEDDPFPHLVASALESLTASPRYRPTSPPSPPIPPSRSSSPSRASPLRRTSTRSGRVHSLSTPGAPSHLAEGSHLAPKRSLGSLAINLAGLSNLDLGGLSNIRGEGDRRGLSPSGRKIAHTQILLNGGGRLGTGEGMEDDDKDEDEELEEFADAQWLPLTPKRTPSPPPSSAGLSAQPKAYSSEPSTPYVAPASPTSPTSPASPASPASPISATSQDHIGGGSPPPPSYVPFSLWDYLQEELLATDETFDSHQEMKWERVTNFLSVPAALEKLIAFGGLVCLDAFLYTFTILPLRFLIASYHLITSYVHHWRSRTRSRRRYLSPAQKCDILKFLLFVLSCIFLQRYTEPSRMYHGVRGQDTVKLYVIFNALEIADRLCCSFGQDLLDSLFSRSTLARRDGGKAQTRFRTLVYFLLSLAYVLAHSLVFLYQLVALNVAINSYDNALLTLLLSNQFVEIKGSVFKKFEKENLFQITCADIVERFQLGLMLFVIAFRNLIEVSGSDFTFLPRAFIRSSSQLETIFSPAFIVLLSEMLVDWLKHAFITKFNNIRPSVYGRFIDVLCRDFVHIGSAASPSGGGSGGRARRKSAFVDQSPVISRRLGFAAIPLACFVVRVATQALDMLSDDSHFDECAPRRPEGATFLALQRGGWLLDVSGLGWKLTIAQWAVWGLVACVCWICLVALKLLIGINLLSYATHRHADMERRASEDAVNDFGRAPIGEGKEEQKYNSKLKGLLNRPEDDASKKKGRIPLEELSRYDMLKRIW